MTTPQITYNPGILGDEELIRSFVVRKESLELVLETLRENAASPAANRHLLVVGPRGIGKTMLVRRAAAEVRANPIYGSQWYALVFGEESYAVSTPGEFWLDALFHLADQTEDERWKKAWGELRDERNERRLYDRALAQLMDFADRENRRMLLVVENLNMLLGDQLTHESAWELRHTLANEPRVMLLGTAISRFEEITNVDRAWFEMFSIHELKPLDQPECGVLWLSASNTSLGSGPLRAIRILTGGNPRLLTILASFAASRSFRQLMDQLVHLVDDHTEYFKSHLDSLAAKERKVFVALLEHWDPVGAAELARITRLAVNEVSALLGRLLKRGAVEVAEQKGRRKLYQAAERLYNIYYLMRRRGHPTGRVRAAVNFMVVFYEGEELAARVGELAREACGLAIGMRQDHYLAYAEVLRKAPGLTPSRIIECTPPEFFQGDDAPPLIRDLPSLVRSQAVVALIKEAEALHQAGRLPEAENQYRWALEQDPVDARAWRGLGRLLSENSQRLAEAEQAFRRAVELRPEHSLWYGLGSVLDRLGRYRDAEQAFRTSIELGPTCPAAWSALGFVLAQLGRLEEAEQSCRKATELKPSDAGYWNNLGIVLSDLGRREESEKAYRTAIDLDPQKPHYWSNLGHSLLEVGPADEAEKVWSRALELHPELSECAVHLLELHLQRGVDRATILQEAREWIERAGRKPNVLAIIALFIMQSGLKEGLPEAEEWAREAYCKDPTWKTTKTLMLFLGKQGKWEEALEMSRPVLDAAASEEDARRTATEFLIQAAAAGQVQAALERLTGSAGLVALEPLAIGLRIYAGETPTVAKEVLEVGQDVAERIRQYQKR